MALYFLLPLGSVYLSSRYTTSNAFYPTVSMDQRVWPLPPHDREASGTDAPIAWRSGTDPPWLLEGRWRTDIDIKL